MERIIAPSILASDFANLQSEVEMFNNSDTDWIHVDVMDGMFVPNISFGMPVISAVKKHANKPLDVHLMIEKPERYIEEFQRVGANYISVHYEACNHLHRVIEQIKATGCGAGVALNPHTPVENLISILPDVDYIVLMSVNPGFGGQKFIEATYEKVRKLSEMLKDIGSDAHIQIDGGVNSTNAPKLLEAGATNLVAGSFVFKSKDPIKTISDLKNI